VDKEIIQFLSDNAFALLLCFNLLKGIAKLTPWAKDDEIIQMIGGIFTTLPKQIIKNKGRLP